MHSTTASGKTHLAPSDAVRAAAPDFPPMPAGCARSPASNTLAWKGLPKSPGEGEGAGQRRGEKEHGTGTCGCDEDLHESHSPHSFLIHRSPHRLPNRSSPIMYLVELRPGKEELYRTGEELAAAIRTGDVDTHSRIYHRATSKWISVTLHPHYKAIAAERDPSASPPLPPGEHRAGWTFFNAASETLEGANHPDATSHAEESKGDGGEDGNQWRRPIALSVTGLLLIMGMQLAFFGPRPPWARQKAAGDVTQTEVLAASVPGSPSQSLVSLASTVWSDGGSWEVGTAGASAEAETPASAPAPTGLPQAPAIRMASLSQVLPGLSKPAAAKDDGSPLGTFLRRWSSAHDDARSRLQSGMRVSRLGQLFAPSRLAPAGGVTETRMALAGASNFIRVYRQQRETIDREYQDSFVVMTKENKLSSSEIRQWYAKVTPKEVPALATLAGTIFTGMDSLLGVLDAQAGAYRIDKGTIHFEDRGASQAYGDLREQIGKAVDVARASGGADSTGPMTYLLEAIGTTRLPKES